MISSACAFSVFISPTQRRGALASEAPVILADEPTGNLDEDTAREIIELLKKTAHELGKCVIVVTHSKQLAEEADEVLEIQQGKLRKREVTK